jgi:hypothetical protein
VTRYVDGDAATDIVVLQQRRTDEGGVSVVVLYDDTSNSQKGVSGLKLSGDGNCGDSGVLGFPPEPGAQQKLVLCRLELKHLTIAELQTLRDQAHGVVKEGGKVCTLERELAEFRES